jgi:ligand-binding sensor domain-containing protein/signal transduction histidine kinase
MRAGKTGRILLASRVCALVAAALCWRVSSKVHAAEKTALPQFIVRSWDSEDGLPGAAVRAIARTPDGYLWVATEGGLARFDGVRFVTLTTNNTPALGDDQINALCLDSSGDLWTGSRRGTVAHRRDGIFVAEPVDEKLRGLPITALARPADGSFWLATSGAGLACRTKAACTFFGGTNGLSGPFISRLAIDTARTTWSISGTELAGLDQSQDPVPLPPLDSDAVEICPSADGGLWVATTFPQSSPDRGGRVLKLKDGKWGPDLVPYPWPQDTVWSRVTALLEDGAGRLWAGTRGAGLFYWEAGKWRNLAVEGPFAQTDCTCLTADSEGTLWLGTLGGQLLQIRHRPVRTLHVPMVAEKNVLLSACAARDGSIWVATDGNGVVRYRAEEPTLGAPASADAGASGPGAAQFTRYGEEQGLPNLHVAVIMEDRRTNLWVGTWGGLFRLAGNGFERVEGPPALRGVVLALCADREGNLWAGTDSGLVRMGPGGAKVFGRGQGVDHFYIRGIEEDAEGRIWLAIMDRGLYLLQDGRFARYGVGKWSGQERIRALHADAAGRLWITTLGAGLVCLDHGQFTQWRMSDGLPSDRLVAVTEDGSDNLWFSSENGIFGCPKSRLESYRRGITPRLLFWRLSASEGLEAKRCSGAGQPVVGRSADGRFWFPNWRTLAVFDPAEVPRAWSPWPLTMEETVVDGEEQTSTPDGVVQVKSSARSYEFHYTMPNLSRPEDVRFRCRLEGLDPDWVDAGAQRVAHYSQLRPRDYTFRVEAAGAEGPWYEAKAPLRLKVLPRFWEQTSHRVLAGLLVVGTASGVVFLAGRARLKRRLLLLEMKENTDRERRRIAQDLHDDLGGSLTEIGILAAAAEVNAPGSGAEPGAATQVRVKADSLVRALDEIVWAVNPRHDSAESLAEYLTGYAQEFLHAAGIQTRVDVEGRLAELGLTPEQRHGLFLAAKEALNNVVRHSKATKVRLSVQGTEGKLVIRIEDNGCGFEPAHVTRQGDGLLNLRERLGTVNGRTEVRSEPGKGTAVELSLRAN